MKRIILHMDMDAFYASVEQLDNPELKGEPVIVGGTSNRGVVSAASYEARKFGVRSAMPIFQAKKRCPQGIYLPVRMHRYIEVSEQVMGIVEKYSPLIEQVSVDEAYMDISGLEKLYGTPLEIALSIKRDVKEATSLSCSIGIAPSKLLAKIASEMHKPDGLTMIRPEQVEEVIKSLPVEKVPGVGKKASERLRRIGVAALGDIKQLSEQRMVEVLGKFGSTLREYAMGIDDSPVVVYAEAKSISSEETLDQDTNDPEVLKKAILAQAEEVGKRLRGKALKGSTVTLKLKYSDFRQMTRSVTLGKPTNSTHILFQWGLKLLEGVDTAEKFRLIGLGVSHFTSKFGKQEQLSLFQERAQREKSWEKIEKAMDTIKDRFGRDAIRRGPLVSPDNGTE